MDYHPPTLTLFTTIYDNRSLHSFVYMFYDLELLGSVISSTINYEMDECNSREIAVYHKM